MSHLSLALLGPVKVLLDGRPLPFRTNKVQALLCFLATENATQPGIAYRREAIMDLLWPDMPLKAAQDNLRQTLYQLRKTLPTIDGNDGETFLLTDRLTIQLNPAAAYDLDVVRFRELTRTGANLAQLEQAANLYRGSFLADFYLPDSNNFEDWAAEWRNKLQAKALAALEMLAAIFNKQGSFEKVEFYARRQLEIDNLRESAYRQLMAALAENGRRHEALQVYERCRTLLLEELAVAPAAETTALFEQIRSGQEISQRQTAFLISSRAESRPRRHNLPAQTTSFVGREKELAEVIDLLKQPECRLLTLLGPGGIGKTRLSLQAASLLAQEAGESFPDGVFQVRLAAVSRIDELIPATAEAIGFSFSGAREPRSQLFAHLKSKELLLLLDNMEQLAGEAALLSDMLTTIPGLTFLVTSRARLNLYEEWQVELGGLEVPPQETAEELNRYSAVQLFAQRARQAGLAIASSAEFETVRQICQLLAGLPLGIELAAGWARSHTLKQIAAEIESSLDFLTTNLQNVPSRQRSLQVTFDHSWQLLAPESRRVLAGVSVFRGGFEKEAAEFVTGASAALLADLVDNSMLHMAAGRYQLHELLRQFGAEKLSAADSDQANRNHAGYYAGYLAERERHRWTAEEPAVLDSISLELKNILAGWQWTIAHLGDPAWAEMFLSFIERYTTMLAYFYEQRSRLHEGVLLFQQAAGSILALREGGQQTAAVSHVLAQVMAAEAVLRFHLGQYSQVETLLEDALKTFRQQKDRQHTAHALVWLGQTNNRLGKFDQAKRCLKESLTIYQTEKSSLARLEALNGLAIVAISEERFEEGQKLLNECLEISREVGYERGIARALSNLGTAAVRSGNYESARPLYEAALTAARRIGDKMITAAVLSNLGSVSCVLGNFEASLAYYEESLKMFREMDDRRWIAVNLNGLGEVLLGLGRIKTAETNLRQSLEISTAIQSVPDSLDSLAAFGEISARTGSLEPAVRRLTFVIHHPVSKPLARSRAERILAELKNSVGKDFLDLAKEAGKNETLAGLTEEILFG